MISQIKSKLSKVKGRFSKQEANPYQHIKAARPKTNVYDIIWDRAIQSSADFIEEKLGDVLVFNHRTNMWNYAVSLLQEENNHGKILEFGVANGKSINYLSAQLPNNSFYGFDSFEGLAEDWKGHHQRKGAYSQFGIKPDVNDNVELIGGWFNDTLPEFYASNALDDTALLHIDSDTYEAAVTIFDVFNPLFKPGLYVLFDELVGFPNWQNGEYKALSEASEKYGFQYEYLAFGPEQCLIRIV